MAVGRAAGYSAGGVRIHLPTVRRLLPIALLAATPRVQAAEPPIELCPRAAAWGTIVAQDGWIFDKNDLRTDFTVPPEAKAGLERLMRTLAAHGPEVVTLYWPLRPMVVPELVGAPDPGEATYDAARALAGYDEVGRWIRAQGLDVVDLLPVARAVTGEESFYFRRDHHPTPTGTRAIATALSVTLTASPTWSQVPPRRYTSRAAEVVIRPEGRAVSLEKACGAKIEPQPYTRWVTTPVEAPTVGLLDEGTEPEVVLLGTSNTSHLYNLPGFVQEAASADVLAVVTPQGGVLGSLQSYLRSPDYQRHAPRFLVWEFALYELFREVLEGAPDPRDPGIYRQIIPSVHGACAPADALLSGEAELGGVDVPLLKNRRRLRLRGPEHYLFLETDDPGLLTFDVVTRYTGGVVDTYPIAAATRLRTYGRFFVELRGDVDERLKDISLRVPGDHAGTVRARVCRAPPLPEPRP